MEAYRYQQFGYLIIPIISGIEFFRCAASVRKKTGKESAWTVLMEMCGYIFAVLIPALFLFTILTLEHRNSPLITQALHRVDRYGVMFLFLGSWWQVFLITALRARRIADSGSTATLLSVWAPYLVLGMFISALILWIAPFNLMWVSVFWFVSTFGLFAGMRTSPQTIFKIFMALALLVLIGENFFFIILDAIV